MSTPPPTTTARSAWPIALLLTGLCLLVRIPALLALPIFGDEAIYLRWAQLIRQGHLWVSLCDPKPPLHFWLIALVMNLTVDPLYAARFLSVLAAALAIPLLLGICTELAALNRAPTSPTTGRLAGILGALLFIFCPFLAFYQRLATADGLFITEMLAAGFLSLRWSRQLLEKKTAWPTAIFLGLALAAALLTRQGLSYTLCLLPPTAILLRWLLNSQYPLPNSQFPLPRALAQLALTAVIAVALWSPYLLANLKQDAANKEHSPADEIKTRILYQTDFTRSPDPRLRIAERNFEKTFIPSYRETPDHILPRPTQGWFYFYLTPPIFFAALLGFAYLLSRRQWLLSGFLIAWISLMLIPPIFLGNVIFSRYVLAAVPPFLIAAAFLLADLLTWLLSRKLPIILTGGFALCILASLLLTPLLQITAQIHDPKNQTLTQQDRYQYLSGWPAGKPTMNAITALTRSAAKGSIVVITDSAWGNPADAAWTYLSPNPDITLYYNVPAIDGRLILTPTTQPNIYLLRKNKYLFTKPEPAAIPENVPVFLIVNDPVHSTEGDIPAEEFFRKDNPNLGPPITFYGMDADSEHVVIFPIH